MQAALMATFAEPVTVHTAAGPVVSLPMRFRSPWSGSNLQGLPVERPGYELYLPQSAWIASGGSEGDTVTVRSTLYDVIETSIDDSGMARLLLRAA